MNTRRRFTLLDLMIAVAATAPGLLLFRELRRFAPALPYLVPGEHEPSKLPAWALICEMVPGLAIVSLGLLVARLVPPGPRRRRALLAPGTTPGLVAALASVVAVAQVVMDWPRMRFTHFTKFDVVGPVGLLAIRLVGVKDLVGLGVASAWALLWLGGGWRPEASWVDRAGRVVGLAWLALALASWLIGLSY